MTLRTLITALLLLALTGCAKNLNEERSIGGRGADGYLPATIGQSSMAPPSAPPTPSAAQVGPSVASLERDNWTPRRFIVPNALPAHQPIYHRDLHESSDIARNRERAPSFDSIWQTSTYQGHKDQIREALFAPFIAAGDIVLFVPRAVYKRPWFVTRGGLQGPDGGKYERSPRAVTNATDAIEPIGEPRFPMTLTPPVYRPVGMVEEPATSPTAPLTPATTPATPATPLPRSQPAPSEPEETGNPANHIGASDGLGSPK